MNGGGDDGGSGLNWLFIIFKRSAWRSVCVCSFFIFVVGIHIHHELWFVCILWTNNVSHSHSHIVKRYKESQYRFAIFGSGLFCFFSLTFTYIMKVISWITMQPQMEIVLWEGKKELITKNATLTRIIIICEGFFFAGKMHKFIVFVGGKKKFKWKLSVLLIVQW